MSRQQLDIRSMAILALISAASVGAQSGPQRDIPPVVSSAAASTDLPDESIYGLDLTLIDDAGRTLRLADLRG